MRHQISVPLSFFGESGIALEDFMQKSRFDAQSNT